MQRTMRIFLAVGLLVVASHGFWACGGRGHREIQNESAPIPYSAVKVRVVDVSNNTGQIYNVDVIGLMWSALDEALKKQGMLWTEASRVVPLDMEVRVVSYNPGNVVLRYTSPIGGKTSLAVKCDVKDSDQVVASLEANETIPTTKGMTLGAWKKIFPVVAEDIVKDLKKKVGSIR